MMAEQASKGIVVSFCWAREQIRAKRGLSAARGAGDGRARLPQ